MVGLAFTGLGRARISTKPRPLRTSSSRCRRRGPSVGSGKSSVLIDVRSRDDFADSANCLVALSTSAISAWERHSIQSVRPVRFGPYQAEASPISGGKVVSGGTKRMTDNMTLSELHYSSTIIPG